LEYYSQGYYHLFIYAAFAIASYTTLVSSGPYISNPGILLALCSVLAWSVYCLWMVGHDCYHHTMAPNKTVNEVLGFITMDCLITSKETWKVAHHKIHHRVTCAKEPVEDRQILIGNFVFTETLNIIYTILSYWAKDCVQFVSCPTVKRLVALLVRFSFYLQLPGNALVGFVFLLAVFSNYIGLLTHAMPFIPETTKGSGTKCGDDGGHLHQMRTSNDIFPQSTFWLFFSGALNCHVVHHVLPSLPRSLHSTFAQKISDLYPNEYRAVHSTRELVSLFLLRHEVPTNNMQMKELWQIVAKRGPFPAMKQLFWDISSLLVLAYIVSCIPPEPMLS